MPRVVPPIDGKPNTQLSSSLVETIAGFSAGVTTTLAVHPVDVLKTRLQLNHETRPQFGGSFRLLQKIVQDEGSWRALYRGIMPNLLGNSVSWALYFLWYGNLKTLFRSYRGSHDRLGSLDYFLASGTAGALTAICTNPIWVIKTRMLSSGKKRPGAYRSMTHGVRTILATEGVRGFYRGLLPSLFGVSHGAIQFMAYEDLKNIRRSKLGPDRSLSNWDYLFLSALSKILAGSITYPYQVVRSRLQTYDAGTKYRGVTDVVGQVWRREGLGGFYKGLGPNIVRVLPSTCVTFLVYENTKVYLPRLFHDNET